MLKALIKKKIKSREMSSDTDKERCQQEKEDGSRKKGRSSKKSNKKKKKKTQNAAKSETVTGTGTFGDEEVDDRDRDRDKEKYKSLPCHHFIQTTFQKGIVGIIKEFRSMKRGNDLSKMTEFALQNANGLNRYKDVGCLDNDRVIIREGPISYIHANYVNSFNTPHRFICTQAPLPNTIAEFWRMVVQEKSAYIIMLCNFVEMNIPKCAPYFANQPSDMMFNDVIVTTKSQTPFVFQNPTTTSVMCTEIDVRIGNSGIVHACRHLHWQDWPDRGVPPADLAPVELLNALNEEKNPIIVHCSAGIGRTGSIVLLQYTLDMLMTGQTIRDLKNYLLIIRQQRNNSIQTEFQYLYVHQVLLLFMKNRKMMNPNVYSTFDKFTKDYEKNVI